jgi:hypothetical protein
MDFEIEARERIAEQRRFGKAPDPGSGGEGEHVASACYLGNLEPAADDAGADINKVARSQRRAEGVPGRRLTRKSKEEDGSPKEAGGGEVMARKMG